MSPPVDACVMAPGLLLTITIERATGDPATESRPSAEIHVHAGGQGVWLSRMLRRMGHHPVLVTAIGGETGAVALDILRRDGLHVDAVTVESATAGYVHDRRDGERDEIVRTAEPAMTRHERDDLYGRVLARALDSGVCAITGRPSGTTVDLDFYSRLGGDLHAAGVAAIGDLHGEELVAFLDGGPMAVLKLSDEEVATDGGEGDAELDDAALVGAMARLRERGAAVVVVSRATAPTLVLADDGLRRVHVPTLQAADARGSGDAMTAALVAAHVRQMDLTSSVRLACAAGAANVTRHGLATAEAGLIEELAEAATVEVDARP